MTFELIFVSAFVIGWLACAYLPWLAYSVATRGGAGLGVLPLCLFAGIVAALAVPILGADGWTGLWLSFGLAFAASAAVLGLRRLAVSAEGARREASNR